MKHLVILSGAGMSAESAEVLHLHGELFKFLF